MQIYSALLPTCFLLVHLCPARCAGGAAGQSVWKHILRAPRSESSALETAPAMATDMRHPRHTPPHTHQTIRADSFTRGSDHRPPVSSTVPFLIVFCPPVVAFSFTNENRVTDLVPCMCRTCHLEIWGSMRDFATSPTRVMLCAKKAAPCFLEVISVSRVGACGPGRRATYDTFPCCYLD
jgi:hypothetical protein